MEKENEPLTRGEFIVFADKLVTCLERLAKDANVVFENIGETLESHQKEFTHVHKRLDDIDGRLAILEGRTKTMTGSISNIEGDISDIKGDVHSVRNETRYIPQIIDMFKIDSEEMVNLQQEVDALKRQRVPRARPKKVKRVRKI